MGGVVNGGEGDGRVRGAASISPRRGEVGHHPVRHGRACPGHRRLEHDDGNGIRGCPARGRPWRWRFGSAFRRHQFHLSPAGRGRPQAGWGGLAEFRRGLSPSPASLRSATSPRRGEVRHRPLRHGRACPGHPRLGHRRLGESRGCPAQDRASQWRFRFRFRRGVGFTSPRRGQVGRPPHATSPANSPSALPATSCCCRVSDRYFRRGRGLS